MTRSPNRALIGAAAAFTVALFVFGSALVRALGADSDSPLEPRSPAADVAAARTDAESLDMDALMLAVENDPFQPDRTRPAERYRMPGDVEPEEPAPPPPPPPVPDFRLIGTVVFGPENGTAAIAVGDGDPRMMSIGDAMLGYRVTKVTTTTATVSNGEREVMLRVPAPSASVAAATTGRAGANGGRGANAGRGAAAPGRNPAQEQQLQQLMQRIQQGGATPALLQQIERLMAGGGANAAQVKMMLEGVHFDFTEERVVPGQNRVQVRPAPARRDTVVIRRPGGGGR